MPVIDLTNRKKVEELTKLPAPTNEGLKQIFNGINRVVIKDGGVHDDKAMTDKVLLTISRAENIAVFESLLEIDEQKSGFYCMCLGTYAIELYQDDIMQSIIGFHHNVSIRCSQFRSDTYLKRNQDLITFLAGLGFTRPLDEYNESLRQSEERNIAEQRWFVNAPKCFSTYKENMNVLDQGYLALLINALNNEIPNRQEQVIKLLQTYGNSNNLWTAYPFYETVPYDLLVLFSTEEIIKIYLSSDRNYKTRIGLGRFLCGFNFRKQLQKQLKYIPREVIDDLNKCFTWLKDEYGIDRLAKLQAKIMRKKL